MTGVRTHDQTGQDPRTGSSRRGLFVVLIVGTRLSYKVSCMTGALASLKWALSSVLLGRQRSLLHSIENVLSSWGVRPGRLATMWGSIRWEKKKS